MKITNIAACMALVSAQVLAVHIALAASDVTARVGTVRVDGNGKGVIYLVGANPTSSCAVSQGFGFDANTKGGESIVKSAISAKLSGATVRITGTGACGIYSTAEDINSLYL